MTQALRLEGQRFGKLTVVGDGGRTSWGSMKWLCRCDCSKEIVVAGHHLRTGHTQSCGCLHDEELKQRMTSHGGAGSKLHAVWKTMVQRCRKPQPKDRKYYDGVTVCDEWHDFASFRDWATENGYRAGLTIDRYPDPAGNYEPANCRWATPKEQRHNRRKGTR